MKALLDIMLSDMEGSDNMFKPTNFWSKGILSILNDLKDDDDFLNFRRHKSANFMYAPVYDHRLYTRYKKIFDRLLRLKYTNKPKPDIEGLIGCLTGYNKAKSDYRIFKATNKNCFPHISEVSESLIGNPLDYYNLESKNYSRSFLNYLLGLNFLKNNVDTKDIRTVFEIGGGYGTLGEILLKSSSDIFYLNIDIPPVAAVSTFYLTKAFGTENVLSYEESKNMDVIDINKIKEKYRCAVLCPWQLPRLKGEFDLFVNFISFQEMEPDIVSNYISIVEKHTSKYVLLRNSKSGKKVSKKDTDIGVNQPTTTDDMYKMFNKFSLVNKDHLVYGQYSRGFISEVACLSKKHNP